MTENEENKVVSQTTIRDIELAKQAVRKAIVQDLLRLPPYLSVEMPNVLRCLDLLNRILEVPEEPTDDSVNG